MSPEHPVEQAIRRSHCAHADRDDPRHQCVGTCHIAPEGVELACRACGDDNRTIASAEILPETRLVRAVLDALGPVVAAAHGGCLECDPFDDRGDDLFVFQLGGVKLRLCRAHLAMLGARIAKCATTTTIQLSAESPGLDAL